MSLLPPHAKQDPFFMTIYDLVYYNAGITRVLLFFFLFFFYFSLQMNLGLHIGFPAFQTFKHFSQKYSDSSVLVARLIYSYIISAGTSSSVFYVYYYCSLESENNLCTYHMKTFLSSFFCLFNTVLPCLIKSPVSDSNVVYK